MSERARHRVSTDASPPSVLIFRIGSIGDTVVALPCFHAIARTFPHHKKILLTNAIKSIRESSVESVLKGSGLIDDTIYFRTRADTFAESLAMLGQLRRLNPQALVYLAPRPDLLSVCRDLVWFAAAGIRRIIGAPLTSSRRDCRTDPDSGELEYEAERLARALQPAIDVDLSSPNWDLRLSAAERTAAARHLAGVDRHRPVVALAPAAKIPEKNWGEEHWGQLIRCLQTRIAPASLVFVGAPDEQAEIQRLSNLWTGPQLNLCGQLTPRESAAVLAGCDLLVCHDSGPMHLAASQGTPCVALFGTYNKPHRWFPFGPGHHTIHEPRGVRNIEVQRVLAAVESILTDRNPAARPRQLATVGS